MFEYICRHLTVRVIPPATLFHWSCWSTGPLVLLHNFHIIISYLVSRSFPFIIIHTFHISRNVPDYVVRFSLAYHNYSHFLTVRFSLVGRIKTRLLSFITEREQNQQEQISSVSRVRRMKEERRRKKR